MKYLYTKVVVYLDRFFCFSFVSCSLLDHISRYFASLSGALAILNMIPCYCLDGQWTLLAFMEYFLKRLVKSEVVRIAMYHVTLLLGTCLLLLNVVFGLWNLRGQGILSSVPQNGDSSS